ncbi:MAG: hypothetical protein CMJ15_01520 [Pelagibacterium sp.]|nr:hypothetical protein [Pelagibacterium sp.]|tara:strand:- start:1166 stop:1681 length:516 start_codon:yes stop_codon:yes gene_type:complete
MSIAETIKELLKDGQLHFIVPALPGLSVKRDIFVSQEVYDLVGDEAVVSPDLERVSGKARAKIDYIASGGVFVFAMDPMNKSVTSLVARNHNIPQGVLDVRINDPKPELRIFGCSAGCDVLVLLTWAKRKNLKFKAEVDRCQQVWTSMFPDKQPLVGRNHEQYFSTNTIPG